MDHDDAITGGIDAYVNAFTPGGTHDKFYTEPKIINAFKNYISHVIKRFPNNPTILGWELGNDLRCESTVPKSSSCTPTTITNWAADIAKFIKSIDSSHLITPG
jgi:mannan endo-1,4-beta-mannosidase